MPSSFFLFKTECFLLPDNELQVYTTSSIIFLFQKKWK
jgi:hypothetical protein